MTCDHWKSELLGGSWEHVPWKNFLKSWLWLRLHFQFSWAKIRVFEQNTDIIKFWVFSNLQRKVGGKFTWNSRQISPSHRLLLRTLLYKDHLLLWSWETWLPDIKKGHMLYCHCCWSVWENSGIMHYVCYGNVNTCCWIYQFRRSCTAVFTGVSLRIVEAGE